MPPVRRRPAPPAAASRVNAIFEAREVFLDQLQARRSRQEIDGTMLIEPDRRAIEPLFGFRLRAENAGRLCQDLREFPGAPALLQTQRLRRRILVTLIRPQAHADRLVERR